MPFLELFDETLDINSTENYELSIQVSAAGLAFCLLDTIRNKFILLRAFESGENESFGTEKINELYNNDDFLTRCYKKVNIVIPSYKYTLVPAPLFDPGKKDRYFTFNHLLEEEDKIISNKVNDPEVYIVSSVPEKMVNLISSYHSGIYPNHHIKPLLNHISLNRRSTKDYYIHLHVEREFFSLIVFNDNKLILSNSFKYRNISDILYYVMNAFKKLGLKQEETVVISGLTERYDDLSSGLSIYIRDIVFAEPTGSFTFSYVFNDLELHRYLNLFNSVNCE